MKEIRKIIAAYDQADHAIEKMALASVVSVEESSYRRIGARMLVSSSGQWVGGISGGCLEGDALRRSQVAIFKNSPSTVVYNTLERDDNQIGIGLGCNGRIEVLFCPIDPTDKNNQVEQLRNAVISNQPGVLLKMQNDLTIDSLDGIRNFYSPIGLDIGAESPEEIALSIGAEIVSVLRDRKGTSLKFRTGSINER